MKFGSYYRYLFLVAFVCCLLSFPKSASDRMRTCVIQGIIPSWQMASFFLFAAPSRSLSSKTNEIEKLQVENQRLRSQLERFQHWLLTDKQLEEEWKQLLTLKGEDAFFERRSRYLKEIIQLQLDAIPAKVVFREPATWSSTIWLNVGEKDNLALGRQVVAKNSPVIIGKTIVGVVEIVTNNRCSVRLITDHLLSPSVRVVRGGEQNRSLVEKVNSLLPVLKIREELTGAKELAKILKAFKEQIPVEERALYLAKGELHGTGAPLWRVLGPKLKGIGFNYDFEDEEGPARNLRMGNYEGSDQPQPLIKTGDLLVTTGMDGIFPPDLHVGVVSKIFPLHEGGCSYDLEVSLVDFNLNDLSEVFVLPPY